MAESKLRKQGISKYNKRFRSWGQMRVRKYNLAVPVILTSDTSLMDCKYLTACYQKAARLHKRDTELWHAYAQRTLELGKQFSSVDWGYILWSCGKSGFLSMRFYDGIRPFLMERISDMASHALMSLMWCYKRLHLRDVELGTKVLQTTIEKIDEVRGLDFIKIVNSAAYLDILPFGKGGGSFDGKSTQNPFAAAVYGALGKSSRRSGAGSEELLNRIVEVSMGKLNECFAQEFRDAINPVTIATIYSRAPEVQKYIIERFRKIMITARPHHLMKAYESAVTLRVLFPRVWEELSPPARQFYVRLSMRHIFTTAKRPGVTHRDVSKHLSKLELDHRNAFRFGPYRIDVGLERLVKDERRDCLLVDLPSAFYTGSFQYTRIRKLQHQVLSHLGWNVRHLRYDDWYKFSPGKSVEKQKKVLEILNEDPKEMLHDKPGEGVNLASETFAEERSAVLRAVQSKTNYLELVKIQKAAMKKKKQIDIQF